MSKRRPGPPRITPVCVDCGGAATLRTGVDVYPHRPDLHHLPFYVCVCGARVGCHPGTTIALGHPAGPATARARDRAHRVFDAIWREKITRQGCAKGFARAKAYAWLARELKIRPEDCHIGHMDQDTALRVVALCTPIVAKLNTRSRRPIAVGVIGERG